MRAALLLVVLTGAVRAEGAGHALRLLLPDGHPLDDGRVQVWLDAAQEEGLLLRPMHDSEFVQALAEGAPPAGVILPDQVHLKADDELVEAIETYVSKGGQILLTYDFGVQTAKGAYPAKSRFSALAGVDFAVGFPHSHFGPVVGMPSSMWRLQIPPGKTMDYEGKLPIRPFEAPWLKGDPVRPPATPQAISGYGIGITNYHCYLTSTGYKGTAWLVAPESGLAAGQMDYGVGKVLFVNIPLGLFAERMDGMLLRSFLHTFSWEMLRLPRLSALPNAQGGLVLNWHFDSKILPPAKWDVERVVEVLDASHVWDRGKFSLHFTVGPDQAAPGDRMGYDLPNNPYMKQWIKRLQQKGHAIGNHGGWIHDDFGLNAHEGNGDKYLNYLIWNADALGAVTGARALEYSAPCGNNPIWAMDWLQRQGVVGYYYVGDTGCAPHRAYRYGVMGHPTMWAFSVSPFGKYAVWEEFDTFGVPEKAVENWYVNLVDFVAENRTNRLIYMHPPFAQFHPTVLEALFQRADSHARQGRFRWYTMEELGQFGNKRLKTVWEQKDLGGGRFRFEATHADTLACMAWVLPRSSFQEKPVIVGGQGKVEANGSDWVISAGPGTSFQFTARRTVPKDPREVPCKVSAAKS